VRKTSTPLTTMGCSWVN